MRHISLAVKVTVVTTILLALTCGMLFFAAYRVNDRVLEKNNSQFVVVLREKYNECFLYDKVKEAVDQVKKTGDAGSYYDVMKQGVLEIKEFANVNYAGVVYLEDGEICEVCSTRDTRTAHVRRTAPYAENIKGLLHSFVSEETNTQYVFLAIQNSDITDIAAYLEVDINTFLEKPMMEKYLEMILPYAVLALAAGVVVMLITLRAIAVHPIRLISKGVRGFSDGERRYTKEDVLTLPIKSRDEIGTLYEDIRAMQGRIVDYTDEVERVTAEKEHLEGQMEMAVRLKLNLMPLVFPAFPEETSFDLYADMVPAERIGGDFYDFFRIDQNHIALCVANVFDGGTVSALFMVAFKILLHHFADLKLSPGHVISAVNNRLCDDNKDDLTLSCWYGVYEIGTGALVAVNAGHEPPVIIGADGPRIPEEDEKDWILGMMPGFTYREYELRLAPGEMLFLYTDGFTDAKNPAGEAFQETRLLEGLYGATDPKGAVSEVQEAVSRFTGDAVPENDMTGLALLRRSEVRE